MGINGIVKVLLAEAKRQSKPKEAIIYSNFKSQPLVLTMHSKLYTYTKYYILY